MALCTFANKQQVARSDYTGKIGDDYRPPALAAIDIGQQELFCVGWQGRPQLSGGSGEIGLGFDVHGVVCVALCSQSTHGSA
jgi:hypothetical protein